MITPTGDGTMITPALKENTRDSLTAVRRAYGTDAARKLLTFFGGQTLSDLSADEMRKVQLMADVALNYKLGANR